MPPPIALKCCSIFCLLFFFQGCNESVSSGLPLLARFDFEDGTSEDWQPNVPENWEVADLDGFKAYHLRAPGEKREIRAPASWSVIAGYEVTSFEFSGQIKSEVEIDNPHRDLCVFFHFQDPVHFYYVHFSASSDERHNIIGLVDGEDGVKINLEPPGESVFRLTDKEWHTFKVAYDADTGKIKAYLDDMDEPILTGEASVLGHGLVGVGSYDDTGYFDNIVLKGREK